MKTCAECADANPDEAAYCQQCGRPFAAAAEQDVDENRLWREFIGPNADRYLDQFKRFKAPQGYRFALTWHWPAFLFDPFLWFLYRKMYLYAAVYAIGPVASAYLTGDFTVGIVWRIMAGVSANYVYFWHVKEHVSNIRTGAGAANVEPQIKDLGGVQPYVIWLGVALHLLLAAFLIEAIRQGPPPDGKLRPGSVPSKSRTVQF